jgi:hypothetical protein
VESKKFIKCKVKIPNIQGSPAFGRRALNYFMNFQLYNFLLCGILYPMDEIEKPDHIDDLKKRLDSRAGGMILHKRQGVLHDIRVPVSTDWDVKDDTVREATRLVERTFSNNSMFKKFFIASIVFFVCAVLFALYIFLGGGNTVSNKFVDISVIGSAYTAGGEDLPLQILVTNKNSIPIELTDLYIEYPKGTSGDASGDIVRTRKAIGTIDTGQTITVPIDPTLYGEQGSVQSITMRLEYHVSGSNAIFTKEQTYGVTLSTAPLSLTVDAPSEATSNQQVTFKVKATSNLKTVASNTRLSVEYPPGFQFESSDPAPLYGNSIWDLGDLSLNQEKDISVTGTILGTEGDERTFKISGGSENTTDKTKIGVVYNSLIQIVRINQPFISANIKVNGVDGDTYVTTGGTPIRVSIEYQNNLPVRVTDVQITANLAGTVFDKTKVSTNNGFYDAGTGTITWSKDTLNTLATLNPSDKRSLDFTITPLPLLKASGSFISSPQITINVSLKGNQPSEGNVSSEVKSVDKMNIQLGTDFQLLSKAVYSIGAFVNSGPIPPHAGQSTTYTVVWSLKNSSNAVSGVKVVGTLPIWSEFTGLINPTNEKLTYDPGTRSLTWDVGSIDRGVGFGTINKEVSFQVKLKPGTTQVNSSPILVNAPKITGTDTFTTKPITVTARESTTRLTNDPAYPDSNSGLVAQ